MFALFSSDVSANVCDDVIIACVSAVVISPVVVLPDDDVLEEKDADVHVDA